VYIPKKIIKVRFANKTHAMDPLTPEDAKDALDSIAGPLRTQLLHSLPDLKYIKSTYLKKDWMPGSPCCGLQFVNQVPKNKILLSKVKDVLDHIQQTVHDIHWRYELFIQNVEGEYKLNIICKAIPLKSKQERVSTNYKYKEVLKELGVKIAKLASVEKCVLIKNTLLFDYLKSSFACVKDSNAAFAAFKFPGFGKYINPDAKTFNIAEPLLQSRINTALNSLAVKLVSMGVNYIHKNNQTRIQYKGVNLAIVPTTRYASTSVASDNGRFFNKGRNNSMKRVIKVRLVETSYCSAAEETPFYKEMVAKCKKLGLKYTEYADRKHLCVFFPEQEDPNGMGAPYIPYVILSNTGEQTNLTVKHGGGEVWNHPSKGLTSLCNQIKAMISRLHLNLRQAQPVINLFESITTASTVKTRKKLTKKRI
jgi:hypothetical protein